MFRRLCSFRGDVVLKDNVRMKAARAEGKGHTPAMEKKTRVRPQELVQVQHFAA